MLMLSIIFRMACYRSSPQWSVHVCSKTMLAHWKGTKEKLFSCDWEVIYYSRLVINILPTVEVFLDCNISQWKILLNAIWPDNKKTVESCNIQWFHLERNSCMIIYCNLDDRLKNIFIGRAEGEFNNNLSSESPLHVLSCKYLWCCHWTL